MAIRQRKVVSARVAQSNSPETDAMPQVMHLVSGVSESGEEWTVKVMSSDPLTAIDEVAVMDEAMFNLLERLPHTGQAATA
jgi:hypothetical protein